MALGLRPHGRGDDQGGPAWCRRDRAEAQSDDDADCLEKNGDLPQGEEVDLGDAKCAQVQDAQMITCALEHVVLELAIDARPNEQCAHPESSLYTLDGEEIDYSDDVDGFTQMASEKILRPVAEIAADRRSS